ncbi:MAG: Gfo/Idh/MocA family oxidoreductase [Paludibaculum sp.]
MADTTRRIFTKTAMAATALSYGRIFGANEKIHMGYVGLGNRGDQVHNAFLEHGDQETVAVCDLRDDYMDFAIKKSRATPKKYTDYKKLLDDKNVEAVVVATPDHWHALMFVEACHAGKDVYCEKPLSLTVWEGRRMVQVAAETKRVSQVGIHRRSVESLRQAAEFVRNGGLGHVTVAKGYHVQNEWPNGIGDAPNGAPPNAEAFGTSGWARLRRCRITKTGRSTTSTGSTTIRAGRSRTLACTTWTGSGGRWGKMLRSRLWRWAASM